MKLIWMLVFVVMAIGCESDDKSYDNNYNSSDNSALYVGMSVDNQSSEMVEVYVGNVVYPSVLYPDDPENYSQASYENWSFNLYDDQEVFVRIVAYNYYGQVTEDRTFIVTNEHRDWSFVVDDYQGIRQYRN